MLSDSYKGQPRRNRQETSKASYLYAKGKIRYGTKEFPSIPKYADDVFDESHMPWRWERVSVNSDGKKCVGYYLETADADEGEGETGFWVLTVDGHIALVERRILTW